MARIVALVEVGGALEQGKPTLVWTDSVKVAFGSVGEG